MNCDAIALDQLARLLHAGADVIGGILDEELDRTAEHAALAIDLLDGEPGAKDFVLRHSGIHTGQRIDHADLDRVRRARRNDKGRRDLNSA